MKPFTLGIFLASMAGISAQAQDKTQILTELNRDIWKPFVTGVNTNQPDLYNGVNSKDFYWVLDGAKPRIMNLEEYIEDARVVMKSRTEKGIETNLEVRFLERNLSASFASEKYIVKYTSKAPGKEPEVFYSIAHAFARKENGVWKKLIQHASSEVATREKFDAAGPLD
jgi:hypothetical protein